MADPGSPPRSPSPSSTLETLSTDHIVTYFANRKELLPENVNNKNLQRLFRYAHDKYGDQLATASGQGSSKVSLDKLLEDYRRACEAQDQPVPDYIHAMKSTARAGKGTSKVPAPVLPGPVSAPGPAPGPVPTPTPNTSKPRDTAGSYERKRPAAQAGRTGRTGRAGPAEQVSQAPTVKNMADLMDPGPTATHDLERFVVDAKHSALFNPPDPPSYAQVIDAEAAHGAAAAWYAARRHHRVRRRLTLGIGIDLSAGGGLEPDVEGDVDDDAEPDEEMEKWHIDCLVHFTKRRLHEAANASLYNAGE